MLKAMGAPLPKQVLVHGWWQKDGQRMSKSTGNVVDPVAVIDEWGVDAFRFYVLRELDIGPDGNWTEAGFKARYSAELANGLGNLVNRSLSMLKRYRNGVVPKASNELAPEAEKVVAETRALLDQNQLQGALQSIWSLVTQGQSVRGPHRAVQAGQRPGQSRAPGRSRFITWRKSAGYSRCCSGRSCRERPARINAQLGLPGAPDNSPAARWGGLAAGHAIGTPAPLFPRKELSIPPARPPPEQPLALKNLAAAASGDASEQTGSPHGFISLGLGQLRQRNLHDQIRGDLLELLPDLGHVARFGKAQAGMRFEQGLARHGGAGAFGFKLLDVDAEAGERMGNLAHYARAVLADNLQHALPGGRQPA